MADHDQSHVRGTVGQSHREPPTGSTGDRPDIGKPGGTVGRDVAEHSKTRDTELAVEAGRKGNKPSEDETGGKGGEHGSGRR
ncbi:MAG: hypothetical protein ACREE2_03240 [Stellaceae bacterium]